MAISNEFVALCEAEGINHVEWENQILSAGGEALPPCAIAVRDGTAAPSPEYWAFLVEQTKLAWRAEEEVLASWNTTS